MRAILLSLIAALFLACPASGQDSAPPEPAPLALETDDAAIEARLDALYAELDGLEGVTVQVRQLPAAAPAATKAQPETPRPAKPAGAVTHREMAAEKPESETSQQAEAEREAGQNLMKKAAPE